MIQANKRLGLHKSHSDVGDDQLFTHDFQLNQRRLYPELFKLPRISSAEDCFSPIPLQSSLAILAADSRYAPDPTRFHDLDHIRLDI